MISPYTAGQWTHQDSKKTGASRLHEGCYYEVLHNIVCVIGLKLVANSRPGPPRFSSPKEKLHLGKSVQTVHTWKIWEGKATCCLHWMKPKTFPGRVLLKTEKRVINTVNSYSFNEFFFDESNMLYLLTFWRYDVTYNLDTNCVRFFRRLSVDWNDKSFFYNLFTKSTDKIQCRYEAPREEPREAHGYLALGCIGYMVALSIDITLWESVKEAKSGTR